MKASKIKVKAPAKVNICLKITGKRADGYHDLFSVMVPVDLCDSLEFLLNNTGVISISARGFGIPSDKTNLVYRAVESFYMKTGIQNPGMDINIRKNIPVAAGLGGGSSDAASTLLALNGLYSNPLDRGQLHKAAVELGADVPFFIDKVPALATGIGEILEPLGNWPDLWYLIITPPIEISTAWVYGSYKMELTSGKYNYIRKILKNDEIEVSSILENDLEKVTSAGFPIIDSLKKKIMDTGAEGAIMSGSGPSVFGIFLSREKAVSARDLLMSENPGHVNLARGIAG